MSAMPYIACALSTGVLAILSEKLINLGFITKRNIRRIFNLIGRRCFFILDLMMVYWPNKGMFGPLIMLIFLSFVTCNSPYLGVTFLTIALGLK